MFNKELIQKLNEAEENGHFFITITLQKNKTDSSHYYIQQKFPKEECILALDHLIADFRKNNSKIGKWK